MKLVVGLGNPGAEYERTRHNAGFFVVDRLARSAWKKSSSGLLLCSWLGGDIELIKPQTYMNRSGEAVSYALVKHGLSVDDLLVIHDDLDIPLGEFKLMKGKGPKVHNGVNSVEKVLKDTGFWRMRVGIDGREGDRTIPGRSYVLQRFPTAEVSKFDRVLDDICSYLLGDTNEFF